jgi:hypothetical protein
MTAVCPNRDGLHRTNPDAHRVVGFVLWIRGISIKAYLATRDPVSGTVYYLLLIELQTRASERRNGSRRSTLKKYLRNCRRYLSQL